MLKETSIAEVLETAIYAKDLEAAERFYQDVLGLSLILRQQDRHLFFSVGGGMLLIFNPEHTAGETVLMNEQAVPKHGMTGQGHVAFAVSAESIPVWRARLEKAGVEIESAVTWPTGGQSLYFRDPAGNSIELATPSIWPHLQGSQI
jgi:catechol 2,3-dioxygenase-like lactoylglutathione lyase family enzyme